MGLYQNSFGTAAMSAMSSMYVVIKLNYRIQQIEKILSKNLRIDALAQFYIKAVDFHKLFFRIKMFPWG